MKVWVRWLFVLASPLLVLMPTFLAGRILMTIANGRCPPASTAGGLCVEPWMTTVMDVVIYGGVVIVALGLILLPAVIAPVGKRVVAAIGFLPVPAGLAVMYFFTGWPDLVSPLVLAVVAGGLALVVVWNRTGKHQHADR